MATDYPSLTKLFLEAVDRFANPRAQMYRAEAGWQPIAAGEMLRRVAGLARALAELGIQPGDRVGLFAPNCPEWHSVDFAIQGLGAVDVPIYFKESADHIAYILNDSAARIIITAGEAQARQIAEIRPRLPWIEHVICAGAPADLAGDFLRYEPLVATAGDQDVAEYRRRAGEVKAEQLATII